HWPSVAYVRGCEQLRGEEFSTCILLTPPTIAGRILQRNKSFYSRHSLNASPAEMTRGRERLVFRDNQREGGTALNAQRWEPYNNYGIDPPPSHTLPRKSHRSSIRKTSAERLVSGGGRVINYFAAGNQRYTFGRKAW
ncbi:MAG TPA: hypothetical protein VJO13_05575, partial [Ktedonobacterales bacterium]|nr:hypothetical protein [Ktedonobacterales bacterium]